MAKELPSIEETVSKLVLPEGMKELVDKVTSFSLTEVFADVPADLVGHVNTFKTTLTTRVTEAVSKIDAHNFNTVLPAVIDGIKTSFDNFKTVIESVSDGTTSITELPSKLEGLCQIKI